MFYTFWINIFFQASVRTLPLIAINFNGKWKKNRKKSERIRSDLFCEVTSFRSNWLQNDLFSNSPISNRFLFEVIYFWCYRFQSRPFCEVTHFAEWPFSELNDFRSDQIRSDSIVKWPLFRSEVIRETNFLQKTPTVPYKSGLSLICPDQIFWQFQTSENGQNFLKIWIWRSKMYSVYETGYIQSRGL